MTSIDRFVFLLRLASLISRIAFAIKNVLIEWESILANLYSAIKDIQVVVVNSSKQSAKLNYEEHKETGLRVIAIGGLALSRGLTLEGLCVSYFYRNTPENKDALLNNLAAKYQLCEASPMQIQYCTGFYQGRDTNEVFQKHYHKKTYDKPFRDIEKKYIVKLLNNLQVHPASESYFDSKQISAH